MTYYKKLLEIDNKKDIWHVCPEYFLDQQQDLKIDRNPLYKFLLENTRFKKDNVLQLEEVRENFNNWIGKKVKTLDNGTFGQVNKDYIIETVRICKHCNKEAKKSCCDKYNNKDRTKKKIVRNLELITDNVINE